MNKVEVDVVQAEFLQTCVDCSGDVVDVGVDFGDDEEFVPGDLAGFDGGTEFWFCVVHLGAVEVDVA